MISTALTLNEVGALTYHSAPAFMSQGYWTARVVQGLDPIQMAVAYDCAMAAVPFHAYYFEAPPRKADPIVVIPCVDHVEDCLEDEDIADYRDAFDLAFAEANPYGTPNPLNEVIA